MPPGVVSTAKSNPNLETEGARVPFRALAIVGALGLLTAALIPVQAVLLRVSRRLSKRLPVRYHMLVCRILGVKITRKGAENLDAAHLIVANHVSWLDIPVMSALAPVSFIAKKEVAGWALFGLLARLQRCLFVDREKRSATGRFMADMQKRLAGGDVLVLFPEGTSSDGNRVLPFRSALMGAAEMSLPGPAGSDPGPVAVQPVTLAYTRLNGLPMGRRNRPYFAWYGDMQILPHIWEAIKVGAVDVTVEFHDPVTLDEFGNRKALAQYCEQRIRHGMAEALTGVLTKPASRDGDER